MLKDPPSYVSIPPALIYGVTDLEREPYRALLQVLGWCWVCRRNNGPLGTTIGELAERWGLAERSVYERLQRFDEAGYLEVTIKGGRVSIKPGQGLEANTVEAGLRTCSLLGEEPTIQVDHEPGQMPACTGQTTEEAEGSVQRRRGPGLLWAQALGELQGQMTRATFDTWLRGSYVEDEAGGDWVVVVKHPYAVDWLANRLLAVVQRTAQRVAGRAVAVQFVVEEEQPPGEVEAVRPGRAIRADRPHEKGRSYSSSSYDPDLDQEELLKLLLALGIFEEKARRLVLDPWVTCARVRRMAEALEADPDVRKVAAVLAANLGAHRDLVEL